MNNIPALITNSRFHLFWLVSVIIIKEINTFKKKIEKQWTFIWKWTKVLRTCKKVNTNYSNQQFVRCWKFVKWTNVPKSFLNVMFFCFFYVFLFFLFFFVNISKSIHFHLSQRNRLERIIQFIRLSHQRVQNVFVRLKFCFSKWNDSLKVQTMLKYDVYA